MKVSLPGVTGTMSMNFLFVLLGIAELSLSETMVMGCLAMLVQSLLHTRHRPRPVQVLFSVASMACSIAAAHAAYHSQLARFNVLEQPLMLLAAAGVFFFTNTFSIALVIALTEGKRAWAVWRDSYFWSFPNYLVAAAVAWMISAASHLVGWQSSLLLLPILYVIYRSQSVYIHRLEDAKHHAEEQQKHAEEVVALHRRTIHALALAIEAKDQTTHDHLERVEVYAMAVGVELGLTESELQALGASALLHDIGKLAVPEHIISKPGKLTPEEFEKMKIHPVVGADILERVRFPYPVVPIVRSHHESWDGSGYPDGLKGEEIPIGARLLTAVDCFDALASERPYRKALPLDEAMAFVKARAGIQFDSRIVELLEKNYFALEEKARLQIGNIEPLKTNMTISRGAAPGAGFESTQSQSGSSSRTAAASQEASIAELARLLDRSANAREMNSVLSRQLQALIPHDGLAVYLRSGEFLLPQFIDGGLAQAFSMRQMPLGEGLSGWVAEHARPIVNGNPTVEPNYLSDSGVLTATSSALSVPFLDANGSVLGVITLYSASNAAFSKDHLRMLEALDSRLSQALQRALSFGIEGAKPAAVVASLAAL
jgi:putative nucleotidyltransferase with HDIG domain